MMKKFYLLKAIIAFGLLSYDTSVFAQGDVSALIKSGPADATKLAQAYLNPLFKGFGIGLNSGWNNSGRAKNMGRFEVRFGITGALIPESDKNFDVTKLGLSNNIRPVNSSQIIAPTVGGSESTGPQLAIYDNNNELEHFTLPGGASLPFIPAPQIQGSVGLPKGIEVTLRAMPKVNLGDDRGTIGMIGGGVKIELLPLLINKTADRLIPIDVAVALGYTKFNYTLPLSVAPPGNSVPKDNQQSTDFSNQRVEASFSGVNVETIISKKLLFFTPFISLGYNTSKTEAMLEGNYPIITGASFPLGTRTYTTFSNPVDINKKDINGLRTNLGFQLNLAVFRLYASYSLAEYNAFNAGLGFGIGK
ncbi:MAG TPA: DUF6588 family protein [Sphingobacteriaceae bacterium]|nr:DUF6588 family protein [Sphingobacteriaceae bacterium]